MSSTARGHDPSTDPDAPTGIVDVSEMTAEELRRFVESDRRLEGEICIQRRGRTAFLLTE